jgi:hypothetical protein
MGHQGRRPSGAEGSKKPETAPARKPSRAQTRRGGPRSRTKGRVIFRIFDGSPSRARRLGRSTAAHLACARSFEEQRHTHREFVREPREPVDRQVLLPAFEAREVPRRHAEPLGELLMTPLWRSGFAVA